MKAEFFRPFLFQRFVCLKDLIFCHTVFGIARIIHDVIADLEQTARIETAADRLRNMSDRFLQKFDMCDIIQIDDRSEPVRQNKIFRRGIIR